jgi:hypothetical protein
VNLKTLSFAAVVFACSASAVQALPICRLGVEVPARVDIPDTVMIVFDGPKCYGVYERGSISRRIGQPVYGYAVTGGDRYPTPLSDFTRGPDRIELRVERHVSKEYPVRWDGTRGGARMPFAQFINLQRGIAIHQGIVDDPNGSHGCIRVGADSARILFTQYSQSELKVIITKDRGSLRVLWEKGFYLNGVTADPEPEFIGAGAADFEFDPE